MRARFNSFSQHPLLLPDYDRGMGRAEESLDRELTALPVPMARRSSLYVRGRGLPKRSSTWKAMDSSWDIVPGRECVAEDQLVILAGSFASLRAFGSELEGDPRSSPRRPYLPATRLPG